MDFTSKLAPKLALKIALCVLQCATLFCFVTGCSSTGGDLAVRSSAQNKTLRETFSQAYVRRDAGGDYDIILVDDPFDKISTPSASEPLRPENVAAVKQIMHIRVLWRPMRGSKPDHPAATNAAIHWYVLGSTTGSGDVLHYAGTGFVTIYASSRSAELDIGRAELRLKDQSGAIIDPIGACRVFGSASANANDRMVEQYLEEVRTAMAPIESNLAKEHHDHVELWRIPKQ